MFALGVVDLRGFWQRGLYSVWGELMGQGLSSFVIKAKATAFVDLKIFTFLHHA